MKYSNGFFVFRTEDTENFALPQSPSIVGLWVPKNSVEDFDCYIYSWLFQSKDGLRSEFHHAPVWINLSRRLVVIFLSNYKLIPEVITAVTRKFRVNLLPYSLAARATVNKDGNLVVSNNGISNVVKTTLLKNDQQRISVLESVLSG
jgi:hypothetical protein